MKIDIARLKEELKEKNLTGKALSEKIGVSEMTISNIIQGKTFPKPETLTEIANILDVDVRELIEPTKEREIIPLYMKHYTKEEFIKVADLDLQKMVVAMNIKEKHDKEEI